MRWKNSYGPHAAGTDRVIPRDAGEAYACQVFRFILADVCRLVVRLGGIFTKVCIIKWQMILIV